MAIRAFDGTDDVIRCAAGAADLTSAFTVAVLVRKTRDGFVETFLCSHTSGGSARVLIGVGASNAVYYEVNGAGGYGRTPFTAAQGWHVVVITKVAGTANVRVHLRALNGTSWLHQTGTRTTNDNPTSIAGGTWRFANRGQGLSARYGSARLAVAGVWNVAMSDAQVEALATPTTKSTAAWLTHAAAAPVALWELNQASVSTPVTDATGGGANQVAITGTSIVADDDPPGWSFGTEPPPPPPAGAVRKDVYTLTTDEWDRFVAALQAIKASGTYDGFTRRHVEAMMTATLLPGETGTQRNAAHRGPSFLPWHRQSLREFEIELQRVDASVTIPYWRWQAERATWTTGRIWQLMGGNGNSAQGYRVTTGPFANWTSIIWNDVTQSFDPRPGVVRRFWNNAFPDVAPAQAVPNYDVSPWRESSSLSQSFRNRLEDYHNQFHVRIGGDMTAGSSPNDPIFWLHHANCDLLWAQWQLARGITNYAPTSGGPPTHNLNDSMVGLVSSSATPASVLDWTDLGYTYDVLGSAQ